MDHIVKMVDRRPLVMFGKSECPMCHSVKSLLRDFGANLTIYELDRHNNGRSIEAALLQMGCATPAIFIGQKLVGGADAIMTLHLQNKLASMLVAAGAIFLWSSSDQKGL